MTRHKKFFLPQKIDINTILYTIVFINDYFNELLRNIIYDNLTLVNTYKIILTREYILQ